MPTEAVCEDLIAASVGPKREALLQQAAALDDSIAHLLSTSRAALAAPRIARLCRTRTYAHIRTSHTSHTHVTPRLNTDE